jgi:hypothetical protein
MRRVSSVGIVTRFEVEGLRNLPSILDTRKIILCSPQRFYDLHSFLSNLFPEFKLPWCEVGHLISTEFKNAWSYYLLSATDLQVVVLSQAQGEVSLFI